MREKRTMSVNDSNGVRTDLTGTVILCLLYSLGMLLSLFQLIPFTVGYRVMLLVISWGSVLTGGCLGRFVKRCRTWCFLFPAAVMCLGMAYFGPVRLTAGFQAFCNVLITRWNIRWEDGIPLFGNGQMTEQALFVFVFCQLLLLTSIFWYLARKRACIRALILIFLCLVPEIVLRYSSSSGSMLLLLCGTGIWMLFFQAGSRIRRLQWLTVLGAVLAVIAAGAGRRQVPVMLELQKKAVQTVSRIRYGEDLLPEGSLAKAGQMQNGDEDTLLVSTEQIKPLYFRGFVGAEYQDEHWLPLTKAAYGNERWGFLDWMKQNSFDANAQYAAYRTAGAEDNRTEYVPENHVRVNNKGANRKYIYTVYSASAPTGNRIVSSMDNGYRSQALFGSRTYEYSETSADIPGELMQLDEWIYRPGAGAEERYLQGENVYRDFVYEHYLDIPQELEPDIRSLFHDGENLENNPAEDLSADRSIYGITQDIRAVMEEHLYYQMVPETEQQGDLLAAFLKGQSYGNSAYYASAGVLALRSFGIPARYAEGYYLSREAIERNGSGSVQLTQKNAHAWTEAYMDGIGWIPVDFTPGFYYNTYTLLRMAELPQNIRKTAALEDQGDEAENVTGNTPQTGSEEADPLHPDLLPADLVWGIVIVFLFLAEVVLAFLELSRWRYDHRIRNLSGIKPEKEAGFLACAIADNLRACGIEIRPGWKNAETEMQIRFCFPEIPEGFYLRVNEILEKYFYGGAALNAQELRLLHRFLIMLRDSRIQTGLKQRIAFRYIGLRYSSQA